MSCAAENFTEIMDETEGRLCLDYGLDERTVYILILILFVILSTPLLAMNITNNTFVQYLGTILRWMTILVVMIVPFVGSRASEHQFSYSGTNWAAIPMMFGISNSAFGCHETLPSLLFPISQKRHNFTMLALTFGGIMLLYLSLSTTALISFDGDLIADVYLLNFQNDCELIQSPKLRFLLTFYPIIPAATNFIIFHIVCQRNIKVLFDRDVIVPGWRWVCERLAIIFFVSMFPVIFGLLFDDVGQILGIGGALISSVSSYLYPTLMVFQSRRLLSHVTTKNPLKSPFGHIYSISFLLLTILFVILSNLLELF